MQKFAFDHANKWYIYKPESILDNDEWYMHNENEKRYMHNPEPVLGNKAPKLLWDFDIQTVYLVALCGWAAKADDSFVCFGAKPDKGFLDMKSRRIRKW